MTRHFRSIRKDMALSAVLVPCLFLLYYLLWAFDYPYHYLAGFAAVLAFVLLPKPLLVARGIAPRPKPWSRTKWINLIATCAIIPWLITTPEVTSLLRRVMEDRLLLDWRPLVLVAMYMVNSIYSGLRAARTVSDEAIYAYYADRAIS